MSISPVYLALSADLALVAVCIVYGWLTLRAEERIRRRVGAAAAQGRRWARTDAVLARVPGLRRFARRLDDARLPLRLTDLLLLSAGAGWIVHRLAAALLGPTAALPLTFVTVPALTWAVVDAVARRRRSRVLAQVPDLVLLLAGAAKAGLSMSASLRYAAADIAEPTSSELERVVLAVEFGTPIEDALSELATRLDLPDLDVLTSAISIQQRSGGDLVVLLTRLAGGLDAARRARREARGATAGLSSQAYLAAGLGLGGAALANRITGDGLERALHRPVTAVLFAISVALVLASIPVIRRIVRVEP